jgi:hypothetical protein
MRYFGSVTTWLKVYSAWQLTLLQESLSVAWGVDRTMANSRHDVERNCSGTDTFYFDPNKLIKEGLTFR